jgi:hypothetical protein
VWVRIGLPFWQGTGATGSAIDGAYVNWNSDEPNGGTTTNCVRMLSETATGQPLTATWADLTCTELLPAVCEGPAG